MTIEVIYYPDGKTETIEHKDEQKPPLPAIPSEEILKQLCADIAAIKAKLGA